MSLRRDTGSQGRRFSPLSYLGHQTQLFSIHGFFFPHPYDFLILFDFPNPHATQYFACRLKARLPHLLHFMCDLFCLLPIEGVPFTMSLFLLILYPCPLPCLYFYLYPRLHLFPFPFVRLAKRTPHYRLSPEFPP